MKLRARQGFPAEGFYRLNNGHCPVCGTQLRPGQVHTSESRGVPAHVSFDIDGVKWLKVAEGGAYGNS